MNNSLFQQFGGRVQQKDPYEGLLQQAQQIAQSYQGNPQAEVQQLLRSGEMTQEQFNQFAQIANRLTGRKG